jgi:hypothetical protein
MSMSLSDTHRRQICIVSTFIGIVHLAVPGVLLQTARLGYRWLLAVEFDPKPGAKARVRLVGVGFLVVAAAVWRQLNS